MNRLSERNIVLFDSEKRHTNLLPLSFTRPISDFRIGILTIQEKWEHLTGFSCSPLPVEYLRSKFPVDESDIALFVAGWVLPDSSFIKAATGLAEGESLRIADETVAFCGRPSDFMQLLDKPAPADAIEYTAHADCLTYVFDIFRLANESILIDYGILASGRESLPLSKTNLLLGDAVLPSGLPSVFLEEGAKVEGVTLNVTGGPIFVARNAEIMEGSCLRGPVSVGSFSKVNMGSKIYGATAIGPWCKVGGEINNAVFFGYSNKAHDGFVGNAVIGEWCNIGAGVNASNLKNDYSKIRVWNYATHTFMRTDMQFCGLIMGDHSKVGINCMLNTATVIGVGVNLHGAGFPRTFIPSFSEGSPTGGFTDVSMKKFCDIAERAMARRGIALSDADRRIFERVREVAATLK